MLAGWGTPAWDLAGVSPACELTNKLKTVPSPKLRMRAALLFEGVAQINVSNPYRLFGLLKLLGYSTQDIAAVIKFKCSINILYVKENITARFIEPNDYDDDDY